MRWTYRLGATMIVAGIVALPGLASAQFRLSGQLVENLPGGGPIADVRVTVVRIGVGGVVNSLSACQTPTISNCLGADGRFTATGLTPGLYLILTSNTFTFNGRFLDTAFNVTIDGDMDLGHVPLTRAPFDIEPTMGVIPAAGGDIPLTVRVRTRWSIPTLPIRVRVETTRTPALGSQDFEDRPPAIDFNWPAGLADSGVVALPPLEIPPGVPIGIASCLRITVYLRGEPALNLGASQVCRAKTP